MKKFFLLFLLFGILFNNTYTQEFIDEYKIILNVDYNASIIDASLNNNNGEYIFVTSINDQTYIAYDEIPVIVELGSNGDVLNKRALNFNYGLSTKQIYVHDIIQIDGGYALCGESFGPYGHSMCSVGFLLIIDNNLDLVDWTVFYETEVLYSMTLTEDNNYLLVGYDDYEIIDGGFYEMLPCVLLVDKDVSYNYTHNIMQTYLLYNPVSEYGNYFKGSYYDIKEICDNKFILVGDFDDEDGYGYGYKPYYNLLNEDILLSYIEVNSINGIEAINNVENTMIQIGPDHSSNFGQKIYVKSPEEIFITGKIDLPYYTNYDCNLFVMKLSGDITGGVSLLNLNYDTKIIDFNDYDYTIDANCINFYQGTESIVVSGDFYNGITSSSYMLQTDYFFNGVTFIKEYNNGYYYDLQDNFISDNGDITAFGVGTDNFGLLRHVITVNDIIGNSKNNCSIPLNFEMYDTNPSFKDIRMMERDDFPRFFYLDNEPQEIDRVLKCW